MKTKDDGGTDGKHITYLQKPEMWRLFEPEIYDFLRDKINSEKRSLSHIEESTYGSEIHFITEYIEDTDIRHTLLSNLKAGISEVILFDPDNGIEVASTNKKNVHKYVTWQEISEVYNSGKSVIIYQHFSRSNRQKFIQDKTREIEERIGCSVVSIQVKHSVYFFLSQKGHESSLLKTLSTYSKIWGNLAIMR